MGSRASKQPGGGRILDRNSERPSAGQRYSLGNRRGPADFDATPVPGEDWLGVLCPEPVPAAGQVSHAPAADPGIMR